MSTPVPTIATIEADAAAGLLTGPWLKIGLAVVISFVLLLLAYLVLMAVSFNNTLAQTWLESWSSHLASIGTPLAITVVGAATAYVAGWVRTPPQKSP